MKYQKLILSVIILFTAITVVGQSKFNKQKGHSNFGIFGGVGIANFNLSKSNWSQQSVNYADSLNDITSSGIVNITMGFTYLIKFNQALNLRPTIILIAGEAGKLNYQRKTTTEILDFKAVAECLNIPVIYKFGKKKIKPYVELGPTILFHLGQTEETDAKISFNRVDLLGQMGLGMEIPSKYITITPELSFSKGFLNAKKDYNNLYTNTISSLHRQYFALSFYFSPNYQK